jgi:N-acetylmuramoyl-L-alanine amidase
MFKSAKAVTVAATSFATTCFLFAYGATTAASAQVSHFEAPVIVDQSVAPVEQALPNSSSAQNDIVSPDAAPSSLAELVSDWTVDPLDDESRCLAIAVFFEARSESLEGQLAVAHVVIERARSGRFAESLCGVVKQRGQFGFVRGGRLPETPSNTAQWRTAQAIAQIALEESWNNPAEGALYFHATHASPNWGRPLIKRIGGHIFYR